MQLSALLANAGFTATRISASAKVHLEKQDAGFVIPRIELECEGAVPGMDAETFAKHAQTAKSVCPVSKALAGTAITLTTRFVA
jgi:lipoyl-dependent peroxiredoxin